MKKIALLLCIASQIAFGQDKSQKLAQKFIITDGHVDLPYRLKVKNFQLDREYLGIPVESKDGDFDFKRAKAGGLNAPFMSIYIPASYSPAGGKVLADSLINMVNYIANGKSKYFQVAKSPSDVRKIVKKGRIALPMGMENGSPIATLDDVTYFKKRGISYITLTHSKYNDLGDSSYDTTKYWNGLSPFGYEVVKKMTEEGIMIDISHVSDSTFYDVMAVTPVPVIASHSSLRHFTPGFERNMTDEMVKMMKDNGGVIMINFGSTFVDGDVADKRNSDRKKLQEILEKEGHDFRDEAAKPLIEAFLKENPSAFADIAIVVEHIDRVVKLAGVDHVGFGSDFDGVGDSLPTGLKDVADYPNILKLLLEKGYSESDIEKICSGNLFRVWQQVIDYAASH
ncbi:membrane dipeptidase [Spirosomataceae bacterium TFI 002]|nr:membrane dipeptidase [Spirosomataceae bacterium TFI 002]